MPTPNPTNIPAVPAQAVPPTADKIMQQIGMYTGVVPMISFFSKSFTNFLENTAAGQLAGKWLGGLGVAVSTYSLIRGVWSFWDQPSKMGALGLGFSAFSMGTSFNLFAHMFMKEISLMGPQGFLIAAGIFAAVSIIKWLTHKPPEELALDELMQSVPPPTIWTAGPLLFAAAGITALMMGWTGRGPNPAMDSITRPEAYVIRKLGLKSAPSASAQPTIIVEQAKNGKPGQVMVVSPLGKNANGVSQVRVDSFVLTDDLRFVSGPNPLDNYYIPFFVMRNGKPVTNPDVLKAFTDQEGLLRAILTGSLTTRESMNAIKLAGAANKYGGVTPTTRQ